MAIAASEFLKKSKNIIAINRLTLLVGAEEYYLAKVLSRYKQLLFGPEPSGEHTIYFDKLPQAQLLYDELQSGSLFSERRLLIIRDAALFHDKKSTVAQELLQLADVLPEDIYIVFVLSKLAKQDNSFTGYAKGALYKLMATRGQVVDCNRLKYYQVQQWLVGELKERNVKLAGDAVECILSYCSYTDEVDLTVLAGEFDKLSLLYPHAQTISKEEFLAISQLNMQVSVFRLINYLMEKDTGKVLDILEELRVQNSAFEMITYLLVGQLKRALYLKLLQAEPNCDEMFLAEYKMPKFLLDQLKKQVRYIKADSLKILISSIVQLMGDIRAQEKDEKDLQILLVNFCVS